MVKASFSTPAGANFDRLFMERRFSKKRIKFLKGQSPNKTLQNSFPSFPLFPSDLAMRLGAKLSFPEVKVGDAFSSFCSPPAVARASIYAARNYAAIVRVQENPKN